MNILDIVIGKKRVKALSISWWLIMIAQVTAVISIFYLFCLLSLGLGVDIYKFFH